MNEDLIRVKIGKGIAGLRADKGMTQGELADLVNVDRYQISRLELGKRNITIIPLRNIINALNSNLSDFFKSVDL